jgi:hypothetical protein
MAGSLYCTLADVRSELNAESTVDDDEIMRLIRQVCRRIDRKFMSKVALFVPYLQARRIPLDGSNINSIDSTLMIGSPLLSLTGVGINSQTLIVGTNVQAYPIDSIPYFQLQLLGDAWYSWYTAYCSDVRGVQFASITGVWGFNTDYANAWLAVDAVTTTAITTTTATTFTVADVDGDNPLGESPRISAGNVIQIDSEWMDVIATNITTNTVTVRRGVNGSTAATHAIAAVVSVYQVEEPIRRAVTRQVGFMYARQGAYDTTRISDFSTITFPKDMLDEVYGLLALYSNM